jgi:hypothetical protein
MVYRRCDLKSFSASIDRDLKRLINDGILQKLSNGLYYYPKESDFGAVPPENNILIAAILKDDKFLVVSPNDYNQLGVGTTQLYNRQVIYNHKRHDTFKFGSRELTFIAKKQFPKALSEEFLLVDLLNNINTIAEDKEMILRNISAKVQIMDPKNLMEAVLNFGSRKTKAIFKLIYNVAE